MATSTRGLCAAFVQPLGHIFRGGDIAAPDDGKEPLAEQGADELGATVQLRVARAEEGLGEAAELAQAAAVGLGQRGLG